MSISGNRLKVLVAKQKRHVYYKNQLREVEFCVYKNYISVFGIPIFPLSKTYSAEIPELNEYYDHGPFVKMPDELFEICRQMTRLL